MKDFFRRTFTSTMLVLALSLTTLGQMQDSLNFLYQKMGGLDEERKLLQKEYDIYKASLEYDYKVAKDEINDKLEIIAWIIAIIGIPGILIIYYSATTYAKKQAKKQIDIELKKIFNEEKEKLIRLIQTYSEESQLKQKKILILSSLNSNDDFLHFFFKELGFKNYEFKKLDAYQFIDQNFDLIFINNEDDSFNRSILNEFQENYPKVVFFYFGSLRIEDTIAKNKTGSASFRTQIYSNLINVLRYHKLLEHK